MVVMLLAGVASTTPGRGQEAVPSPSRLALVAGARAELAEGPATGRLSNAVCSLAYAPDGRTLAVGLRDPNTIVRLDATTLAVRGRLVGHLGMVSRLAFAPDGAALASGGHDGTVRVWDLAMGRERLLLDHFQGNIMGLALAPDGARIFAGELVPGPRGRASVWDARDGKFLGEPANGGRAVADLAVSPDGRTLAGTSWDGAIALWDATTLARRREARVGGGFANAVAFAEGGRSLVVACKDGSCRTLDAETLQPRIEVPTGARGFLQLAVGPGGRVLATADGGRLRLWRAADGAPLGALADLGQHINAVAFAPDGWSVAVGGLAGSVRVFEVRPEAP